MAKIKGYDVYFTLRAPACVLVAAKTKREASEEAKKVIDRMSKEELADRLFAALDFEGVRIVSIDEVDELDEEDLEI